MQGSPNPRPWTSTGHHTGQHICPQPLGLTTQLRTQSQSRRWASEWSFICVYSHSPLLTLLHYHNVIIIEIKCTINVISLNHPKTIPTLVCRKIVFYETHPWGCWKSQVLPPIFQEKGFHKGVNVSRENLGAIWESVHHTSFGSSLSSRRMASPCFCLSCYSPMHLTSKQNFHYSPRCQGFWRMSCTPWQLL